MTLDTLVELRKSLGENKVISIRKTAIKRLEVRFLGTEEESCAAPSDCSGNHPTFENYGVFIGDNCIDSGYRSKKAAKNAFPRVKVNILSGNFDETLATLYLTENKKK